MSDSAKKLTTLDDLTHPDHIEGLKSLIVDSPKAFSADELFEVRFDETRLGPIWNQDLKAYVAQDPNFPVSCFVSQFAAEEWMPILQHPFFQRRRPQLVARNELNIESEEFFVLKEGKKIGPYTAAQVEEKLSEGIILVNDQISSDAGQSWGRLYEIEEFDRRSVVGSGELPFMPEWQVFNNSFDEVEKDLSDISHNSKAMETDAIASLAYLEKVQSGKAGVAGAEKILEERDTGPLPKVVIGTVLAMAFGLILASWLSSRPSQPKTTTDIPDNAPTTSRSNTIRAKSPSVPTTKLGQDVKKDNRPISERVINKVNRAPTNSAGFRKSRAFKKSIKPYNNNANNDFAYDQDRPLEQDPIGSKLSRESVNPNDDYQKELRDEGYGAEADYADDRFIGDTQQSEQDFAKIYESEDGGAAMGESGSTDQVKDDAYDAY